MLYDTCVSQAGGRAQAQGHNSNEIEHAADANGQGSVPFFK